MNGRKVFFKRIIDYHETKLYESDLKPDNEQLDIGIRDKIYLDYDNVDISKIHNNNDEFNTILKNVSKYKLKKNKRGENAPINNLENEILTKKMEKLTQFIAKSVATTIYFISKTGYLYFWNDDDYNRGDVFFIPKDKMKQLTPLNSRCLINCDNRLKVLTRYIRDVYINPIFENNRVDTKIHRVKNCVVKCLVGKKTKFKLCFESIANIANIIHTTKHKYLILDLSNAFNNVTYTFMYKVLEEYLVISDKEEKTNVCRGLIKLISEMKYYCQHSKNKIRRNKGVPQGSSISVDLFVLCMDYIIKKLIIKLRETLNIEYNIDYELVVYGDDILILIKTPKFENNINPIMDIFVKTFQKYHFKMNPKKSKKSAGLPNCDFEKVKPKDKYLGLYFETDVHKYLAIIEKEIQKRWKRDPRMKDILTIEQNLKENKYTVRQTMSIRGKLQYRMRPFAKNIKERYQLFDKLGYPNIAKSLFEVK